MKQESITFMGLDVHKETIHVALAESGGEARSYGTMAGDGVARFGTDSIDATGSGSGSHSACSTRLPSGRARRLSFRLVA